jgi:predicted nucleic acid-binding protein
VIYIDTSIALAHLFGEERAPPPAMWREPLVASRLLVYEFWNRIHAAGLAHSHGDAAKVLLAFVALIDLTPLVLARALEPFPSPVRTLDGLHIATIEYLRRRGDQIELASYDRKLVACAQALGIAIHPLSHA